MAWEIAKNLALAGVGRMSVVADEGGFGGPGDKLMSCDNVCDNVCMYIKN